MKIRLSLNIVGALLLVALISTEATSATGSGGIALRVARGSMRQRGDVAALRELDGRQSGVLTALHWAAERGETQVATLLLGAGGDVHAGTRKLHTASPCEQVRTASVVKVLLEAGSDAATRRIGRARCTWRPGRATLRPSVFCWTTARTFTPASRSGDILRCSSPRTATARRRSKCC